MKHSCEVERKPCQVDPEQLGTTKTHKLRGSKGIPPSRLKPYRQTPLQKGGDSAKREHENENKDEVEDRDIKWCYRLRNLARSRPFLHNQTPGGVSVTHTHTPPTVTGNPGATWVLTFLSMLLLGFLLNSGNWPKPTDWVMSLQSGLFSPEPAPANTLTHPCDILESMHFYSDTHQSNPHQQKCECRVALGDEDRQ